MIVPQITAKAEICRGCDMCVLACSLYHTGQCNPALARIRITRETDRYAFTPQVCLHCIDPACMAACPFEAMELDNSGIVYIVEDQCDSCGICQDSCSYNAITYNQEISIYIKCDLCRERNRGPICVEVCPTGALSLASTMREEE